MKKIIISVLSLTFLIGGLNSQALSKLSRPHGFEMGAVISYAQVQDPDYCKMISENYTSITASNEFKAYSLFQSGKSRKHPEQMPVCDFKQADAIMDFAKANNIKVRGHVLVWDAYMNDTFFRENYMKAGKFVDAETMKKRLEYYINDVISHFEENYPGVIYCWDVVNEAVADSSQEAQASDSRKIRKTRGGAKNLFYEVLGPDYVELSFKYAREAVKKTGHDIKLYYNDYSTFNPSKMSAIINLIKSINKNEKLCDGMGMQGYIGGYGQQPGCMSISDIAAVKAAIMKYSTLGIEVQITELALRNYKNDSSTRKSHAAYTKDFYTMLRNINKNGGNLTAVSTWGLCDDPDSDPSSYSYKMNGPFCGVFTKDFKKKPDYDSIVEALK